MGKHKKKSQANLKKAKEIKLEMLANQDNSEIPSFAAMLDDNINDETTESKKRKSDIEDVDQPVNTKKSKNKYMEEETTKKIKKTKKNLLKCFFFFFFLKKKKKKKKKS